MLGTHTASNNGNVWLPLVVTTSLDVSPMLLGTTETIPLNSIPGGKYYNDSSKKWQ
jgi:hypothetical protein